MTRRSPLPRFRLAIICCAMMIVARPGPAKDLGVRGAVWPVAEPDLLARIETRLAALESSGYLARRRREALDRARERIEAPVRVKGIGPARVRRTRLLDPSITVEQDIQTDDGTLIAAQGTRINPLEVHPLTRDLLFIDGSRPAEVAWALGHGRPARIVLLAGRPLDLMRAHGRPFFFDQNGRLSKRFGLRATPSLVAAEGSALRITEVPLEDEAGSTTAGGRP